MPVMDTIDDAMAVLSAPVDRRVLVMMGAAGSGKSTLADAIAAHAGVPVVSYDAHQRAMPGGHRCGSGIPPGALAAAWTELAQRCASGPVIVDGTHVQDSRRRVCRDVAAAHGWPPRSSSCSRRWRCVRPGRPRARRRVPSEDIARQHAAVSAALLTLPDEGHAVVLVLNNRG